MQTSMRTVDAIVQLVIFAYGTFAIGWLISQWTTCR